MKKFWAVVTVLAALLTFGVAARELRAEKVSDSQRKAEILAFNARFTASILKMDTPAIVGMWAEDGVSLLPGAAPIEGRAGIQKMMDEVNVNFPGVKVTQQDDDFRGLEISGDWASEWANTHQQAQAPDGKPPMEIYGKMLLVLHREKNGQWKIVREAWTSSPKPGK